MLELAAWRGDRWQVVTPLRPGQHGSLSDNITGHRDVYLFWCADDDTVSVIAKVGLGLDELVAQGFLRHIELASLEEVAVLHHNQDHVMLVQPDGQAIPHKIRFRHIQEMTDDAR